ncbi:MAG: hypothetical protein JW996_05560, partial [Candidatus Cloacimonetes bacterium]|nr:hypothetical protein [Candidatus Cloacimonadota bacterium]
IMLNLLKNKASAYNSLTCVQADLTDYTEKIKYNLIIISYSSFQQLLTRKQQLKCLKNIRDQLSPQGILAIDVGQKICEGNDVPGYRLLFKAWHPDICSEVEMYTSWITDKSNKIRYWTDKYCWIDKQGNNQQFINKLALKECNRQDIEQLVYDSDLKIKSVYGSFLKDPVSSDSTNIIYLIGKN